MPTLYLPTLFCVYSLNMSKSSSKLLAFRLTLNNYDGSHYKTLTLQVTIIHDI